MRPHPAADTDVALEVRLPRNVS